MRTTTTSITKTCAACGMVNRLVIMTSGIPPRWRIGCSDCGETIVGASRPAAAQHDAQVIPLPVPAARRGGHVAPFGPGRTINLPAIAQRRRTELARRLWVVRSSARASTGVSLAAVCGIVVAAFLMEDRGPGPVIVGEPATVEALAAASRADTQAAAAPATGTPAPAQVGSPADATGSSAFASADLNRVPGSALVTTDSAALPQGVDADPPRLVYTHARLSPEGRSPLPGVPAEAIAAAGDPGVASIVDLRRPLPGVYPDPREGVPMDVLADQHRMVVAARNEETLDLSGEKRRDVQRRLQMASHDPQSIDGIFGPLTRTAIAEWQAKAGLPATGYLDEPALALLAEQTDAEYRGWQVAERKRRKGTQLASANPVPRPQSDNVDGCVRQGSGKVAYGQSVRCDIKGLRESFGSLRNNLAGLFERPERSSLAGRDGRSGPGGA